MSNILRPAFLDALAEDVVLTSTFLKGSICHMVINGTGKKAFKGLWRRRFSIDESSMIMLGNTDVNTSASVFFYTMRQDHN